MKRIWIDVDDGVEYKDALLLLESADLHTNFIKGMGVYEKFEDEE